MAHPRSRSGDVEAAAPSSPASDPDPYGGPSRRIVISTTLPPHIDASTLAHAMPVLGPFFGYTTAARTNFINARIFLLGRAIGRPPTVPEEQAFAHYAAQGFAISSWAPSLGITFGLYRWWATMGTMRVFGYGNLYDKSVNEKWKAFFESGEKKPAWGFRWDGGKLWAADTELLKSMSSGRKEIVVHWLRTMPYISLGLVASAILIHPLARTWMGVRQWSDPRLKDVTENVVKRVEESMQKRSRGVPATSDGTGRDNTESTYPRPIQRQNEAWQTRSETVQRYPQAKESDDDARPTSDDDFFTGDEAEQHPTSRLPDEVKSQGQGGFQRNSQVNPFDIPERQGGYQQERYERQAPSSASSFDGAEVQAPETEGSAWDRIRQGSISKSSSSDREARIGSYQGAKNDDNGFAYSRTEEEKAYARIEAQKEFDARVEKEREGENFDSGKRW